MKPNIFIVVPVYNESEHLEQTIEEIINTLDEVLHTAYAPFGGYKIVLAEDGSTDGSDIICMKLAEEYKNVQCLHYAQRLGKGGALKRALKFLPDSGIFIHIDADLSTHPRFVLPSVKKILEGYDIVIGSRWHKNSIVKRGIKRQLFSLGYNLLVNILFGTGIRDHQCGFKAFNLSTTKDILTSAVDNRWFWDTEVLIRAKQAGLKIYEMPIEWVESQRDSKVSVWRDTKEMLMSVIKFRVKLWREKNE